ncbi:nephrin-like [Ruditapes philippinarum]|uniref:nephrin-like n=1 Tax=Ruditapes philippinarum TaxID=129788 RepID=UPI00295BE3A0|nr:nephrin-like [Ruditapes philippinarum]
MQNLKFHLSVFALCFIQESVSTDIVITPKVIDELEKSNVSFKCVHNGTGLRMTWRRKDQSNICYFETHDCSVLITTQDRTTCTCEKDSKNETTVSLQISNISSADHNTSWFCAVVYMTEILSQKASLLVKVPVKTLTITPFAKSIQISENNTTLFTCKTSYSRPIPAIKWILKDHNHLELTGEQTNKTNHIGMTSAESALNYKPSRTNNGRKLCCIVSKSEVQKEEISSSLISINVTYPPDSTLMINGFLSNGIYYVIENNSGTLTCNITGGNPKPLLSWTRCFDNEINSGSSSTAESVTNTWRAMSDTDRFCTCQSIQMERNDSVSIKVKVLYPPTIPILTYGSLNVSGNIYIIQNEQLLLDCSSNSKPPPTYQWEAKRIPVTFNKTLQILVTEKMHEGNYTCLVTNTMNATERIQNGSSRSTVEVHVLYPPTINTLENLTFIEGDTLNFSCSVTHGNPKETVFLWTSEGHMTWSSQYITIRNISRDDDMNYNCSVYNIMTPTGQSPVKGTDSKMWHLSVDYYATIKEFFVHGYKSEHNVTTTEYDNVTFICDIDSKPISNTSLRFTTDTSLVWTHSNMLSYTLGSAKCTDAGTYSCFGKNKHNIGVGSTKQLNLFIRCSPRANPTVPFTTNLTLASNVTAVLYFPILAYPKPESVIWQKYSMSNWISVTSNNNINISNNELNVSLSIYNLMETEFGRYRLIISNDVGSYIQNYYINAEDRPNPPTGFRVLNKLTTASTATVQWFPSFNGGKPQHFVLNYSKSLQKHWTHEEIEDTGEPVLIYTINGLSSNSVYYIFLHSVNMLGSSKLSARLEIKTKEGMHIDGNTSFVGTTIGISIGAVLLLLILFIGIYTLRRFKLRYQHTSKNVYQNTIGPSTQKINSTTEYGGIDLNTVGANIEPNDPNNTDTSTDALPQNPYEKLDKILKDSNQYSELKQMDENREDVFWKSNSDSAPDALQKDFNKAIYMNMKI